MLREIIRIYYERALARKAMRILAKQEWSVEFLETLLVKAAKSCGQPLEMQLVAPNGARLLVRYSERDNKDHVDDNVLDRLDDAAFIENYVLKNGRAR